MGIKLIMVGGIYFVVQRGKTLEQFGSVGAAQRFITSLYDSFYAVLDRIDELNEVMYYRPLTADELDEYERLVYTYKRDREYFDHDC